MINFLKFYLTIFIISFFFFNYKPETDFIINIEQWSLHSNIHSPFLFFIHHLLNVTPKSATSAMDSHNTIKEFYAGRLAIKIMRVQSLNLAVQIETIKEFWNVINLSYWKQHLKYFKKVQMLKTRCFLQYNEWHLGSDIWKNSQLTCWSWKFVKIVDEYCHCLNSFFLFFKGSFHCLR